MRRHCLIQAEVSHEELVNIMLTKVVAAAADRGEAADGDASREAAGAVIDAISYLGGGLLAGLGVDRERASLRFLLRRRCV